MSGSTAENMFATWAGLTAATPFLIGLITLFTLIMMLGLIANTATIIKRLNEILDRLDKYERKLEIEEAVRSKLTEREKTDTIQ